MFDFKDAIEYNFELGHLLLHCILEVFSEAQKNLSDEIVHWGFVASKADYYGVLREADVVVSTANHEFYGVAM